MVTKINEDPRNEGLMYAGHPVFVDSVFLDGCRVIKPQIVLYYKCGHRFGYIKATHDECGNRVPIMHPRDITAKEVHTLDAIRI